MAGLARWTTALVWLALIAALAACVFSVEQWRATRHIDAMIADRSIVNLTPLPTNARVSYAVAWNFERLQRFDEAIRTFIDAQATVDPTEAARAWFALGNVYFEQSVELSRQSPQEGPAVENAQFGLARDAYRAALRIEPTLHGARYNLELLERLAPARIGDGWRRNTDPIAIQPDRHQGWTTIQESAKRGLP